MISNTRPISRKVNTNRKMNIKGGGIQYAIGKIRELLSISKYQQDAKRSGLVLREIQIYNMYYRINM